MQIILPDILTLEQYKFKQSGPLESISPANCCHCGMAVVLPKTPRERT